MLRKIVPSSDDSGWRNFSWDRDGIYWRIAWDYDREDHVCCLRDGRTDVGQYSPCLSRSCSTRWDHLVASSPPVLWAQLCVVFPRRRVSWSQIYKSSCSRLTFSRHCISFCRYGDYDWIAYSRCGIYDICLVYYQKVFAVKSFEISSDHTGACSGCSFV